MTQSEIITMASRIVTLPENHKKYILSEIDFLSAQKSPYFGVDFKIDDEDTEEDLLAVEEALRDVKKGNFITEEEMDKRMQKYLV